MTSETSPRGPRFRTILCVDDDERALRAFTTRRFPGRAVLTAQSGVEALEIARANRPDLVILDLRLGKESGQDVLRSLKSLDPTIVVVVVSGYLSVAAAVGLIKEGATTVMTKPVTLAEVLDHLFDGTPSAELAPEETPSLARAEWEHMMRVLHDCNGNVSLAARRLGLRRATLQRKLKKNPPSR